MAEHIDAGSGGDTKPRAEATAMLLAQVKQHKLIWLPASFWSRWQPTFYFNAASAPRPTGDYR
jgi:hypothetical protein